MNKWLHKFMKKPDISDKPENTDISDIWAGNLGNMPGGGPDKPDRLDPSLNLSGLSGSPGALFGENLRNIPEIGPDISDKTDRLGSNLNLSGLSGRPQGLSDENLEINSSTGGDKSARFKFESNMSPLSLRPRGLFTLDRDSLLYGFEERIAIAEYDGLQTSTQVERIAYLDAFMAVLATLPYEDVEGDWLGQRIKAAQAWLLEQGLSQPK